MGAVRIEDPFEPVKQMECVTIRPLEFQLGSYNFKLALDHDRIAIRTYSEISVRDDGGLHHRFSEGELSDVGELKIHNFSSQIEGVKREDV